MKPSLVALLIALAVAACRPDGPAVGDTVLGPWLLLDAVELHTADASAGAAIRLERSDGAWRIAGSPFEVDQGRIEAVERAFRAPIAVLEERSAAQTARALGLGEGQGLRVRIEPSDAPPVSLRVGRDGESGTWIRHDGAEVVVRVDRNLATLLGGTLEEWRSPRILPVDSEAVRVVENDDGGARVTRGEDGRWRRPGEAGVDATLQLAINRLVRSLASANGDPTDACAAPARPGIVVDAGRRFALAVGERGCVYVDGVPAFRVGPTTSRTFEEARRVVALPRVPDLGGPDADTTIRIVDGVQVVYDGPVGDLDRELARALTVIRAARAAPAWSVALRLASPSRVATLELARGRSHRILLWWHPTHPDVVASIDGGPRFVVRDPRPLRPPPPDGAHPPDSSE